MPRPEIEEQIVDRWLAGEKADDIAATTGVSRSTVYAVARNRGMTTSRGPRQAESSVPTENLLSAYAEAQQMIGRLRLRIEQLEDELAVRTAEQREVERRLRDLERSRGIDN